MRFAVYVAVLMIALGSVLLGLDWQQAPMSSMVDTEAGLHGPVSLPPPPSLATAPAAPAAPVTPQANIGVPIVPPKLVGPGSPPASPSPSPSAVPAAAAAQAEPPSSVAAPEPQRPACNVEACTAAYHSFTPADCTYQPSNGPRRLCTKQPLPTVR